MNKYIIPICYIQTSTIYNKIVFARSFSDCQDKVIQEFSDYSDKDEWNDFIIDMDENHDIIIGEINDIEEL